jgi:hypothetical protein
VELHHLAQIAFLALAVLVPVRFFTSGDLPMLRMMGSTAPPASATPAAPSF